MFRFRRHLATFLTGAAALAVVAVLACGLAWAASSVAGLKPISPQPAEADIAPGLAVEYISMSARHVDDVESAGSGHDGGIIEMLDWNVGDGEVMTSGETDGVAARITGMIRFPEAGTYIFTAQSNDGVRLLIGDELVIEDPDVHPDRFSENVSVSISEPGWYEFYMIYFERKGTSTLELYWQPPGTEGFVFVPAEAFAHPK